MIGPAQWDGTIQADDIRCLSASTIKSAMAAPGLENWRIWETARRTVDELPLLTQLAASQRDKAEKWIVDSAFSGSQGRLSAADAGTLIHSVVEAWLTGAPAPDAPRYLWPHLELLATWVEAFQPQLHAVELAVFNPVDLLGGRLDAILSLNRGVTQAGLWLIDYKTHQSSGFSKRGGPKKTYVDSHGIQLTPYFWATHYMTWEPRIHPAAGTKGRLYLVSPEEMAAAQPMPALTGAAVVDIYTDRVTFTEVPVTEAVYRRALAARDLWWWINAESAPLMASWEAT